MNINIITDKMKGKITVKTATYVGIGVLGLIFLIWALRPSKESVDTARVQRGVYEQIIQEDGVTRVREKYTILSPYSGQLQRVERHAGDTVKKGDTLAIVAWDFMAPIRSPENGSILRVIREDAGPIEIGQPIMEIGNTSSLEVVIDVLSTDSVHIRAGNTVKIPRWGGENALDAKVRLVEPQAFIKISSLGVEERRVHILADITTAREIWAALGDNYRLECQIVVFRQENALKVHTGALFRDGAGWAVFRVVNGKALKTPVTVARRGPLEAMVESGLSENDEVIIYPGDTIKNGSRVREM